MNAAAETLSTPAYARVRERIRADIIAGGWLPGHHVTLAELSSRYGVSLSPVREALLHLQGEGLIELRQHRGAVVRKLDDRQLADLYDLRGALQSLFARRAAERADPEQLDAMARHEAAYAAAAAHGDAAAALAANEAFHGAIEAAADNPQASALFKARSVFVNAVRFRLGFGPARMREASAQHGAILRAIGAREPEAAAEAAFTHSMDAKRDLLGRLRAQQQEGTP